MLKKLKKLVPAIIMGTIMSVTIPNVGLASSAMNSDGHYSCSFTKSGSMAYGSTYSTDKANHQINFKKDGKLITGTSAVRIRYSSQSLDHSYRGATGARFRVWGSHSTLQKDLS